MHSTAGQEEKGGREGERMEEEVEGRRRKGNEGGREKKEGRR